MRVRSETLSTALIHRRSSGSASTATAECAWLRVLASAMSLFTLDNFHLHLHFQSLFSFISQNSFEFCSEKEIEIPTLSLSLSLLFPVFRPCMCLEQVEINSDPIISLRVRVVYFLPGFEACFHGITGAFNNQQQPMPKNCGRMRPYVVFHFNNHHWY